MILTIAALFLPLFPLSMVQNLILSRIRAPFARGALVLLWPQIGVTILQTQQPEIPAFIETWALLSAAFYAVRLLTVRDLAIWAGLFASSAVALTWGLVMQGVDETTLRLFALWFSLPAALLILLTEPISKRLGAAYAGLFAGLVERQPRLALVLTAVMLCAVATPPFPGFFALLNLMLGLDSPGVFGVLGIWLVWSWAAIRLVQGFVTGDGREISAADLGRGGALVYYAVLAVFVVAGLQFTGGNL